jgi:transposase
MLGRKERDQLEFFVCGSLRDLVPDDHVLVRVDRVLDLSWLGAEVSGLYADGLGRPGIDPEVAVRLMLAGFLLGIVQDRRLMREAQVNLAIRWFVGFGMSEALPDHSSLTRIRQRWGAERFRTIFARVVLDCQRAGLVAGDAVHMDATLIRADVSLGSLAARHVDAVDLANLDEEDRLSRRTGKFKKLCVTDPDATMSVSSTGRQLLPSFKQHTSVDDRAGIIVDIEVVTGEESDFARVPERLDALEVTLGRKPGTVTADRAYGIGRVYTELADRKIEAVIPPRPVTRPGRAKGFPVERFRYDAKHDLVRCPRKEILTPRSTTKTGRWFRADADACRACPLRARCIPDAGPSRKVHISKTHVAVLRARRKRQAWGQRENRLYARHRWLVEGAHGLAKTLHGMSRATRRGLENMKIQALLTATAINLKRLALAILLVVIHALVPARNQPAIPA